MEDMTIDELREYAKERGIDLAGLRKKADIIAFIESWEEAHTQVVEAEVIEEEPTDLAINFQAGSIKANFKTLEEQVDQMLAKYEDWHPDPSNPDEVKDCARERKYLNGLATQLDNKRKDVKRAYELPLKEFEAQANAIRDKIKATASRIKAVEDEADQARRDREFMELQEYYEAFAGALLEVVSFEQVLDDKWLNKSVNIQKAKAELEQKVIKIVQEWDNLKALNLENLAEAEAHFFEHLDFAAAVQYAQKLAEDKRKIAELKETVETPVPEPFESEYEPEYEPFDPMTMEQEHRPVSMPAPAQPMPAQPVPAPIPMSVDDPKPRVMVITSATTEQCKQIGRFCGSIGVTGVFKSGTLAEVYEREVGAW